MITKKLKELLNIHNLPFNDLIYRAAKVHREYQSPNKVQLCSLLSIKTGGCPEDCSYCPQSARYKTDIDKHKLLSTDYVVSWAKRAKEQGASRVCLGAAWREVKEGKDFDQVIECIKEVSKLKVEVCCTLGMLSEDQAIRLKEANLYAYNHNIDSSPEFYEKIISTRTFSQRLKTLENVRDAGLTVCCGGIIGMGESVADRLGMLETLTQLEEPPESIPINLLVAIPGTPLADSTEADAIDLTRMVATTRITFPRAKVRLSAGRNKLTDAEQALCFFVGANSIHFGEKLLTQKNQEISDDQKLLSRLGISPMDTRSESFPHIESFKETEINRGEYLQ